MDITKLKSSWTKYDAVKMINIASSGIEEIQKYISGKKGIDEPSLRNFLGIESLTDPIPEFWTKIQDYPMQKRLFALLAAIFTHNENIDLFANNYSREGKMGGVFTISEGKQFTNLRSALVESGAAPNSSRRKDVVDFDISQLFENGDVGILFRELLENRLRKIDWDGTNFLKTSVQLNFHKALGLDTNQFENWINGNKLKESTLKVNLNQLKDKYSVFQAYKVNQWLKEWDEINFTKEEKRTQPKPFYLMFKMDARLLKRLSDVHRRKANTARSEDLQVQRKHTESRSQEIRNYIRGGFPWSTISEEQRVSEEYKDLKMPGLLPTAVIANIIGTSSERNGKRVDQSNEIKISNIETDFPTLEIPNVIFDENWNPDLKPLEIIDGQHRLWAFEESDLIEGNYELPVIAYVDLDLAWQAYLFYTINIKPVKINTSLGYDLYPLLRTQKWLENSKEGLMFYRENRAQEIVELLWSYSESPWFGRIKMLGEGDGNISQAAFIKALTSSFLKKSSERTSRSMGGLFSDSIKSKTFQVLNWNRTQQAAFIILIWDSISIALLDSFDTEKNLNEPNWAKEIREKEEEPFVNLHPGLTSKNSFLSRDQGVRGSSMFINDFFYELASQEEWNFNELAWEGEVDEKKIRSNDIDIAIEQFKSHKLYQVILEFSKKFIEFDWRTPSAPYTDEEKQHQSLVQNQYKGSSGYSLIWKALIELFKSSENDILKDINSKLEEIVRN